MVVQVWSFQQCANSVLLSVEREVGSNDTRVVLCKSLLRSCSGRRERLVTILFLVLYAYQYVVRYSFLCAYFLLCIAIFRLF